MPHRDDRMDSGLGALLSTYRRRARLSQEQLAERAQLSVRAIRDIERGRVQGPRRDSVRLLVEALALDAEAQAAFEAAADQAAMTPSAATPAAQPVQLPPDLADFTGRAQQVAALRLLLGTPRGSERSGSGPIITAVSGPAGIGKTVLAVRVAHLLRPEYPDGQFYVSLQGGVGQPLGPAEVLARFLRALGDGLWLPPGLDERAERFRALLADRRMLIVLDDAASEQQIRPLVPAAAGCGVLVTSRVRLAGLESAHLLDVDVLGPEHALELLGRLVAPERIAAEPNAAHDIVALCAGLPLALRTIGARLSARAHWSLRQLASRLADEHRRLDELSVGDLAVRASLSLTYRELGVGQRKAFQLLGFLHADGIPLWAAASLLHLSVVEAEDVVEELVDARLLNVRIGTGETRYEFHDLVRLYARERAVDELSHEQRRAALMRTLSGWLALAEAADAALPYTSDIVTKGAAPRRPPPGEVVDRVLAEPLRWFDVERSNLAVTVQQACALDLDEIAWELAASLVSYASLRTSWELWRLTHEAALACCERAHNVRGAAAMLAGLGKLKTEQREGTSGDAELAQALEVFRDLHDRHAEARVLIESATALQVAGRDVDSLPYAQEALAIAGDIGSRVLEADALVALAQGHLQSGRWQGATLPATEAAAAYRELGKHRGEAQALWQLAAVRRAQEEPASAVLLLRRALSILERVGDRRGCARVLLDLGKLSLEIDDLTRAESDLAAAVEICRDIGEHHFEHQALGALAALNRRRGEASS